MQALLDWFNTLQFSNAAVLWLLPLPWLFFFISSHSQIGKIAERHLLPWLIYSNRAMKVSGRGMMVFVIWCLLVLALSGPRHLQQSFDSFEKPVMDVVFVLDVSHSMAVRDVVPDRITRAKTAIVNFSKKSRGIRLGMVVFAARPHLLIPPTIDKNVFTESVNAMSVGVLPTKGSNVTDAIQFASDVLKKGLEKKLLILVSDGDFDPDHFTELETEFPLHVWGVGLVEAAPIPGFDSPWFSHDNEAVYSSFNKSLLQALARSGKGSFQSIGADQRDWPGVEFLNRSGIDQISKEPELVLWDEHFSWLLLAAMVLLLYRFYQSGKSTQTLSLLVLGLSLHGLPGPVGAAEKDGHGAYVRALDAFANKDFDSAIKGFQSIPGYRGRFGLGSAYYEKGNYVNAIKFYTQAIASAPGHEQRADAIYNLANSFFKLGDYSNASQLYNDVLLYRQGDEKAKNNLEYSRHLQREVEKEIKRRMIRFGGSGSGAESASANVSSGGLSLENKKEILKALTQGLPQPEDRNSLIETGIRFARLAAESQKLESDPLWKYRVNELHLLPSYLSKESGEAFSQWKRLFELEEDIQVPLQYPEAIPGVRPW